LLFDIVCFGRDAWAAVFAVRGLCCVVWAV